MSHLICNAADALVNLSIRSQGLTDFQLLTEEDNRGGPGELTWLPRRSL